MRPNHNQTAHTADIYKPSRSPLSTARYPYPSSPQLQQPTAATSLNQVVSQRYPPSVPTSVVSSAATVVQQQQQQATPLLAGGVGGGGIFRDYRPNRISLLHPEYASTGRSQQYIQPQQPQLHQPQQHQSSAAHNAVQQQLSAATLVCVDGTSAGQQPLKKIRLQRDKDGVQPLTIDTREGVYKPLVEAISPTLPEQLGHDDQAFRTTKDELIQQIGKVDREIAKAESQIVILTKKQLELEEIAKKPIVKSEVEEDAAPKHQSLPQKIYAENRKKAQSAHAQLDPLGSKVEWPLYNQPGDAPIYHENRRRNAAFKRRLLEYFKRKHEEKEQRNSYLTETYSKMMQEWLRKVDKIESSTKRKAKEAKNREFFEKVFPELRKQREDKERFNRVGARVKSEADMEEIMDNLQEQALEDKKMRSYAVIPPILFDQKERKVRFDDNNGYIEDMEIVYKSRQFLNVWTPSEKEIFKEKYLQHPKNFGVISSYLDRKSVSDCVQYYYLSKKTENYKQLFRKARQRTRSSRNNTQKVNSTSNASVVDILTTGVTTRLQREQQARTVGQQPRDPNQTSSSSEPSTSTTPPVATTTMSSTSATTTTSSTATEASPMAPTASTTTAGADSPAAVAPADATSATSAATNCVSTSTSVISTSCSGVSGGTTVTVTAAGDAKETVPGISPPPDSNAAPREEVNALTKTFLGFGGGTTEFSAASKNKFLGGEEAKEGGVIDGGRAMIAQLGVAMDGIVMVKNEVESPQEVVSDQNLSSVLTENKKKKERRKEKDTAIETSDEEANNVQDIRTSVWAYNREEIEETPPSGGDSK